MLTRQGEGKQACFLRQKEFLKNICFPLLEEGYMPVIKAHPLPARFHTFADLKYIVDKLSKEHKLAGKIHVINEAFWPYAQKSRGILCFGSSGIYELYSAGFSNVVICGWLGDSRSKKFSMFDSVFARSERDVLEMLKEGDFENRIHGGLLGDIFCAYSRLHNNSNAEKAASLIIKYASV